MTNLLLFCILLTLLAGLAIQARELRWVKAILKNLPYEITQLYRRIMARFGK